MPTDMSPNQHSNRRTEADFVTLMHGKTWHTKEILWLPADKIDFKLVDRNIPEPSSARTIRLERFRSSLDEKLKVLQAANPDNRYEISDGHHGPVLSLVRSDGSKDPKIWDGTTVAPSTHQFIKNVDGSAILPVHQIQYSEWIACKDPAFAQAYIKSGLEIPYAGVGVSVIIETKEGIITLTRRGLETPVYPGMLYSPGGGPKPGQKTTEALIEEILEETGMERGNHYNPADLVALAYVSDSRHQGCLHERPEIVFFLPTEIAIKELSRNHNNFLSKKGKRESDVWGLVPYISDSQSLAKAIIHDGNQMCPPTEAALAHLILYRLCKQDEQEMPVLSDHSYTALETILLGVARSNRKEFTMPIALADFALPKFL